MPDRVLTPERRADFARLGFAHFPGFVPAPLLARLRSLFDELLVPDDPSDKVVIESPSGPVVCNVDLLCQHGNLAALELLGYPPLLELAQALCGEDFFLIQEFAVIKHRGDQLPVLWHKDMVHRRSGTCFTAGIYLDASTAGDGALQVVPGSHSDPRGICELAEEPHVEMPMRAGDMLIHDMMLAHASPPMQQGTLRRVIYFEFLSAAHVATEAIYPPELVVRRTRLSHLAARHHAACNPDTPPFDFALPAPDPGDAQRPVQAVLTEIYAAPINARPSSYCINGVATFDRFD
ncbi:MAG: phytanoyl-CoA dioxygenase family protein [Novosphingobium sp.]